MLYLWNEWVQLLSESYVRMSRGWQKNIETPRKTSSFGMSESSIDLLVRCIHLHLSARIVLIGAYISAKGVPVVREVTSEGPCRRSTQSA